MPAMNQTEWQGFRKLPLGFMDRLQEYFSQLFLQGQLPTSTAFVYIPPPTLPKSAIEEPLKS